MARRKCVICGEWIQDNNDSVPYKKRYVHKKCFDVMMKNSLVKQEEKKKRPKQKTTSKDKTPSKPIILKEGMSEEEYQKKKEFFSVLRDIIPTHNLEAKDYAIADNYIKKYKFTWEGMRDTLHYYFHVLEKNDFIEAPLRIVPQYYNSAYTFYQGLAEIKKENEALIKEQPIIQVKDTVIYKKKQKKKPLIDLAQIGCDDNC